VAKIGAHLKKEIDDRKMKKSKDDELKNSQIINRPKHISSSQLVIVNRQSEWIKIKVIKLTDHNLKIGDNNEI